MNTIKKISGYFKQLAGEVSGNQALHDEGRREARTGGETAIEADATAHRAPPGAPAPGRDWSVGFDENAPRQDREPVRDYSDTEQLKLFRLVPVAAATDTNWDIAPNQGEVVVRARSSGDARVVAAEAELDYTEIDALPGDGNSTTSSSAFRNEKLYTVVDETDPAYDVDGPRGLVAGTVRLDNIRPTEL